MSYRKIRCIVSYTFRPRCPGIPVHSVLTLNESFDVPRYQLSKSYRVQWVFFTSIGIESNSIHARYPTLIDTSRQVELVYRVGRVVDSSENVPSTRCAKKPAPDSSYFPRRPGHQNVPTGQKACSRCARLPPSLVVT